jgi:biopolymer transport protein ExbD
MGMSTTGRIGICLILVGVVLFGGANRWLAPRPDVAWEMPVSLSAGHVITGNFSVHPGALYYIDIELDKRSQLHAHCEPRSVLSTRWVLFSEMGQVHGSSPWEDTGLTIADLYSEKTRYAFDVEILPGASCLNASNPRLKVQTHPYPSDLYVALTWFSIVPVGIGLALLMRACITRRFGKIEETRMFPDMVVRNMMPIAKHAPLRVIHGLPHWGLFCGSLLWILIFIFMILRPLPSKGLFVSWEKRHAVVWEKSPWPDTLEVYIRTPARFFVNGEEVDRNHLRSKLIEQLGRRAEWTVYLEADADSLYRDTVYAIDVIQGCGAKLIWVTPKIREQQ